MAPLVYRDYHCSGDLGRYSLRTTKRGEEDFHEGWHDVDVSKINGKLDFFRCMGLQMRSLECQRGTSHGFHKTNKLNIPNGVKLRDCSVVILGTTCKICGSDFKCVTDVKEHSARLHNLVSSTDYTVTEEPTETEIDMCKIFSKPFDEGANTIREKSPVTKLHGKLRLTLKIGPEVIAQMSVKRKHLKMNTIDMATQTDTAEVISRKDSQKSVVSRIDYPAFENSPYRCCSPPLQAVNSTNRYLVADIVANSPTNLEENVVRKDGSTLDRLTESRATSTCEEACAVHDVLSNTVSSPPDVKPATDNYNYPQESVHKKDNSKDDARITQTPPDRILKSNENDNIKIVTEIRSKQTVQPCQKNISLNSRQHEVSLRSRKKSEVVNRVQVIMPLIVPIIMPNNDVSQVDTAEERSLKIPQEQNTKTFTNSEQDSDDEVQEVLRIVRGSGTREEINHESPNRVEQEMLVQDAIRDMLKMERQGWHLLELESVQLPKRKRFTPKSNATNDEPLRKKKRVQLNFHGANVQPRNPMEEKQAKEPPVKVQKPNQDRMYPHDNVKENLMTCNGNISIPSDVLRRYGINYYNEVLEINNNIEDVQQPISCFLGARSAGAENKSNKPAVIDLVNDTDE